MKRFVNTCAGRLEIVTLSKFLENVQQEAVNPGLDHFRTVTRTEGNGMRGDLKQYNLQIVKGNIYEILKNEFIRQSNIKFTPAVSSIELFEMMAVESAQEFGEPDFVVRIAPRMWAAAASKDFSIIYNDKGIALVVKYKNRNNIFIVSKLTA